MASLDPVVLEHFRGKRIRFSSHLHLCMTFLAAVGQLCVTSMFHRSVCCGEQHSLAVAEMGDVFVWGRGREVTLHWFAN